VAQVWQNIGHIVSMSVLLGCSAFFSGSETALFNLTRRQIKLFGESKSTVQNLIARLLKKPGQLLNCLLFGNMTVNVLFYAVASVFAVRVREHSGLAAAGVLAFVSFSALVLFGETVPKSLAYTNSHSFSVIAALPVFLCVQIFTPIGFVFKFLILEPILRIFLGPRRQPSAITVAEFKSLVDMSCKEGLITDDENRLLTEVIELGSLKVRHVMKPRVDMVACSVTDSLAKAREQMRQNNLTKLPVYIRTIDDIVGSIHLRQILLRPETSLDRLVQPVHFVPEQKTVESLLSFFRKTGTDVAIVVDEYGGIAGSVEVEDIAEELFGHLADTKGIEPIKQLGPFEYRLAGHIAIHEWADVLGVDLAETRLATIGGLVTALLGRIPKSGDIARFGNLKFTVERVRKHRIETVVLTLEAIATNEQ